MNINATLLGQMITFALFIWVTMKFIWPPITHAMSERQKTIADGLEAAEKGKQSLEQAREDVKQMLHDSKVQAQAIIDEANQRASHIIAEAKAQSKIEGQRLLDKAKTDIDLQVQQARETLRSQVATIALKGAEKILQQEISQATNDGLVDQLMAELR